MTSRTASVVRNTLETRIRIDLDIDGKGTGDLHSGVPFLDHMLDQIVRHGLVDLSVHCDGDTDICLLYTSPSPRDQRGSRMPSSA